MESISYNKEVLTATGEMIRLFSNISIFQFHDENGNTISPSKARRILVPLKFAQTSRILKSIMNPTGEAQEYPLITLEKTNMSCDLNRNTEIHHDMATRYGDYDPNTHPPIPMNISFTLNIFAKYPEDVDMIVGNFAPWFNTDVFVTSPHPKLKGKFLNHQVLWDGDVTYNWKSSLQNTEQDIITASTNFTFKTELFAGYEKLKDDDGGIIHKIVFDFSPASKTELYTEYDESKIKEHGNKFGGFYAVPYNEDFEAYSERMVANIVNPQQLDYDSASFNVFNEEFNSAIINCDFDALTAVAEKGANIHQHSYWPYAFASVLASQEHNENSGYTQILNWLEEHEALKPIFEHYPPVDGTKIKISDLR